MDDQRDRRTLEVVVGRKSTGDDVLESLLVAGGPEGPFTVLATPAFAQGVARGDIITQAHPRGELLVLERGGNLAIQVFAPHEHADELTPTVEGWQGSLDARGKGVTAFSVPVSVGFPAVEGLMAQWASRHPRAEWYYGNVYGPDGVTPLGWWQGI